MKVRLTRKYAESIDGVNLRGREPGDVFEVRPDEARLLMAEEWAIPERRDNQAPGSPSRRQTDCSTDDEVAS